MASHLAVSKRKRNGFTKKERSALTRIERLIYFRLSLFELISIFVIAGGFFASQLVQPIFFDEAHASLVEPESLYIQGYTLNESIHYYRLFPVDYEIDVPFFGKEKNLTMRLPEEEDVDLVCTMKKENPYLFIYFNTCNGEQFVPTHMLDYALDGTLTETGQNRKKVKATLFFRERLTINESSVSRDDRLWYSTVLINTITTDFVSTNGALLGYGMSEDGYTLYGFYEITVRSDSETDIRDYYVHFDLRPHDVALCQEGLRLTVERVGNNSYIPLDMRPRETKKILLLRKIVARRSGEAISFRFKEKDLCSDGWSKYIQYFRR